MTGSQRQAARLGAKAKANAAFYAGVRPHTNATTRRADSRRRARAALASRNTYGKPGQWRPTLPGAPGTKDRHIIRRHVIGGFVIKLHATKGWRLERA